MRRALRSLTLFVTAAAIFAGTIAPERAPPELLQAERFPPMI